MCVTKIMCSHKYGTLRNIIQYITINVYYGIRKFTNRHSLKIFVQWEKSAVPPRMLIVAYEDIDQALISPSAESLHDYISKATTKGLPKVSSQYFLAVVSCIKMLNALEL